VAEGIIGSATAATFSTVFRDELTRRASSAIGFKSIIAYRYGLDFNPDQPTELEVTKAAGEWLDEIEKTGKTRLSHPVLLRFILWTAVGFAKPIQFHVGYGDSDINLHRCDPTQMTEFIRRTVDSGVQITLLHCYPFIREAGFLAQVYPHVWLDTGAILNYTGPSSVRLVRDSLELSPLSKVLFSSDAFGLPELYYCGALVWRRGTADVLEQWRERDFIGERDALRYIDMMARTNALRCYSL
jgi:predicted TIM-barrel fold metal-dependent hydrolase